MKKLLFILLPVLALAFTAQARADASSPVDFVRANSKQVLDLLKKEDGHNTRKIREQVEAVVLPKFDFKRMTAYAVGKNWRIATPDQQNQLVEQFQGLLVRVYASTMTRYKNAIIDVKPNALMNNSGSEAVVHTAVSMPSSSNQKPVSIDYTLYKTPQGWRVYNVSVEGASIVTAYRNQFDTEIRTNGVDGLIKSLKDKNAKLAQGS